jgi:hypothetical protein
MKFFLVILSFFIYSNFASSSNYENAKADLLEIYNDLVPQFEVKLLKASSKFTDGIKKLASMEIIPLMANETPFTHCLKPFPREIFNHFPIIFWFSFAYPGKILAIPHFLDLDQIKSQSIFRDIIKGIFKKFVEFFEEKLTYSVSSDEDHIRDQLLFLEDTVRCWDNVMAPMGQKLLGNEFSKIESIFNVKYEFHRKSSNKVLSKMLDETYSLMINCLISFETPLFYDRKFQKLARLLHERQNNILEELKWLSKCESPFILIYVYLLSEQ